MSGFKRIGLLMMLCLVLAPLASARDSGMARWSGQVYTAQAPLAGPSGSTAKRPGQPIQSVAGAAGGVFLSPVGRAAAPAALAAASPYTTYQWIPLTGGSLVGTDANANYWIAFLTADPSITLTISGTYPSVRYVSIEAYDSAGALLAGLVDKDFPPDQGSVNPFVAGTQRGFGTYTLHVVFGPPPSPPAPGTLYVNQPAGASVSLLYRLYLPDTGASKTGNVPLPVISTQTSGGATAATPIFPGQATPAALPQRAAATPTPGFTRAAAGAFTNVDEAYLVAVLPGTTQLYVVRFQAPTTPHTLGGGPLDPNTQLRYWSVCVNNLLDYPYACRADEQVVLKSPHRQATIVLGLQASRPANATRANGVTWISLGTIALPYAVLLRNMLPASSFTQSAFAVPVGASPGPYMGPYAPSLVVCTTQQFEQNECKA